MANSQQKGLEFERQVAELYRTLGARRVVHNTIIAGSQIDLYIEYDLPDGTPVRIVLECKAYARPVGIEPLGAFSVVFNNLQHAGHADKGIVVSQSGFTAQAKAHALSTGLELLEIADLLHKLETTKPPPKPTTQIEEPEHLSKYVFVLMPFSSKFNNVFWFGIRGAVEKAGFYCDRADEIQLTGNVLDIIKDRILKADIIVADMSEMNPNVFYEVGIAHTLNKPTVLLVENTDDIPFDLRSQQFLIYCSNDLMGLQEKLADLLSSFVE